jgi:tetratricopeptide (TPR) repeat protein
MSVIPEPRLFRIRILQRAYSALQKDLPYLEERIYFLRVLVSNSAIQHRVPPPDVDVISLAQHHYDLGTALYDRYLHTQEPADIEDAELHLRLALSGHSLTTFPGPSCVLGSVLRTSTSLSMNMQRLDEALSLHRQSFAGSNTGCMHTLQQAHCSRELGLTLLLYGRQTSDEHALRESILHLRAAHNMYTDMKAADHSSCRGLSQALEGLYGIQLDRDRATMEDAVSYGRLSLALCGPAHRDLYEVASKLTNVLSNFFVVSNYLESLDEAIGLCRALIGSAPPRWAKTLAIGLITRLNIRVVALNSEEDLVEAISHTTQLLVMSGPDDKDWPKLQELLSLSLHSRFIMAGAQEDIEAAARAAHAAASASTGTPNHAHRVIRYAGCRLEQYAAFGDAVHLDESIDIFEWVIQTTPPGNFTVGIQAAASLLVACHYRYGARGDATDLDRAIKVLPTLAAAREHLPINAVYDSSRGGDVLLSRYLVTGALEDLDQATMLHQEAAASAQAFAQHTHEILNAYATTLRIRHEALNEEESATQALELHQKALRALSGVHPGRPEVMCGLARLRLCAGSTVGDISEALRLLLDAINNRYCPAYRRLKYASDVLTYLATYKPVLSDEHALKLSAVYSGAIDLLPQVASFGLVPRARLAVIAGMGQLTIQGAAHAISIGRLDQALEMLEAGRSIFWTQGLRLRTPFTNLPKTIGDRLAKITSALAQSPREGADKDRELSSRRKLGDEFQTVLAEARLEPGFHDLLRNTSFESLTKAAECHPLVVFLGNDASGHAIIVSGNAQCRVVGLPGATTKVLQALSLRIDKHTKTVRDSRGMKIVNKGNAQPTAVYRELWTLIMAPIVDALQWPVSTTGAHHILRELMLALLRRRKHASADDSPSVRPACSCSCRSTQPASTPEATKCAAPTTSWRRTPRP